MDKNKKRKIFIYVIVAIAILDNVYNYFVNDIFNSIYIATVFLMTDMALRVLRENEGKRVSEEITE